MGAFLGSSLYYHVGPSSAAPTSYQPSVAGANRRDACHPELDSESVAPPGRFLSCGSEWLARRCRDAPQGWSWTSMSWTGISGTCMSRPPCRHRVRFRALDALETCVRSMDAPDDQGPEHGCSGRSETLIFRGGAKRRLSVSKRRHSRRRRRVNPFPRSFLWRRSGLR